MRKPRHRIFDYTPRFYKPEKDVKERRKRRLGFQRQRTINKHKRNPLIWLMLIVLVIYIYLKLSGSL